MKISLYNKRYVFIITFMFNVFYGFAQNNCPAIPTNTKWDTSCFIPSVNVGNKLLLPQAHFGNKYNGAIGQSAIIPSNRPDWALGIAHAWSFARNINGNPEHPKISYWMATVTQESQMGCDAGAIWPGGLTGSPVGIAVPALGDDGCFQIEGINNGSAYGALIQYYPLRFRAGEHQNLIGGVNFATSAIVKSYYDVFTERIAEYRWGWNWKPTLALPGQDPYAFEKLSASAYNAGIFGFQGAVSFMNVSNPYWTGLPATTAGYATQVGDMMSVLEQNAAYPVTTINPMGSGSYFIGYYDGDITWNDVLDYFDQIEVLYHEINFATNVIPEVQTAWEQLAGSTANSINFQDLGPIIDKIVLSLPREDAMAPALTVDGAPVGPNGVSCSGDLVPYSRIQVNGSRTFCQGLSLELEAVVEGGGGANPTFRWRNSATGNTVIGTERTLTISPTEGVYTYTLEVCNGSLCNLANCDITITVNDCGGCGMTVNTIAQNTPCKGMDAGTIDFVIAGNTSNDYTVEYSGSTSRGNVSGSFTTTALSGQIENLVDGFYNIVITDNTDNSCKAYSNVRVNFTTAINEFVDASIVSTTDCVADLEALITRLPAPCQFRVDVSPVDINWPAPGDRTPVQGWERWINAIINPSSGGAQSMQNNDTFTFPYDQWTSYTADVARSYYTLSTGDRLDFYTQVVGTPGASQLKNYRFRVFDEEDDLIYEGFSLVGQSSQATIITPGYVGGVEVSCPYNPAGYDFTWAPPINNQTDTPTKSTGDVNVSPNNDVLYTVTAINQSNPQCRLTDTVTVKRDPACIPTCTLPTSTFTGLSSSPLSICQGTSTNLNAAINGGTGTLVYQWYNGTNAIGTPQSFTAGSNINANLNNVNSSGSYTLRVAEEVSGLSESTCFIESTAIIVNVEQLPDAPSTNPISTCLNTTAPILSAIGTTGASFTWYNAQTNGTAFPGVPTLSTATAGNTSYWVSQTVNGCESNRAELVYTVHGLPIVNATSNATGDIVCVGQSVTLTGTGNAVTYTWDNSVTNNTVFNPTTTATYTVTGTDANSCENTDQITITVNELPTVIATSDATNNAICEGQAVTLIGTGAVTYTWANSVTDNTAFVPSITASYTVTGTDANGCENTDDITITVNELPMASISGTNMICNGANTPIEISFTAGQPDFTFTYNGSISGNITVPDYSDPTYTFNANTAETFTLVSLTDANGCDAATLNSTATVTYHPTLSANSSLVCGANAIGGVTLTANQFQVIVDVTGGSTTSITASVGGITFTEISPNRWASNAIDESVVVDVTVIDANGCNNVVLSSLTQQCSCPATGTLNLFSGSNTICPGGFAELSLSFGGGAGNYDLTINGGSTPQVFTNVSASPQQINISEAGNYTATVRSIDDNCTITVAETIQINEYTVPTAEILGDIDVCDQAGATGDIEIELTGVAPWDIEYSDGTTTTSVTGILTSPHTLTVGVGNYTLTSVTDNHCVGTVSGTASVNPVQVPVATITTPSTSIQNINADNFQLIADNIPSGYTGTWSIFSGQGTVDNNGNLTGLNNFELGGGEGTTVVRYTVNDNNNVCTATFAEVTIVRRDITMPNAGNDVTICATDLPYLRSGNGDQTFSGSETFRWIAPSGVVVNINGNDLEIPTGTPAGTYTFTFEIENSDAGQINTDEFTLVIDAVPSTATVGATIITCASSVNLNAINPTQGIGTWSIQSGQGQIMDGNNPTSLLDNLITENQTTELLWTVNNGVCAPSTATLQVQKAGAITTPTITIDGNLVSGTTFELCASQSYLITGNDPASGEAGEWVSGFTGTTASQSYLPTTVGTEVFTWQISNTTGSGCNPESKTITITINDVPDISSANITYQDGCEDADVNATLSGVNNASSYTWSAVNNATLVSSNNTEAVYRLADNGSVSSEIRVEATNQCGNAAITQTNSVQTRPDNAGGRIDGVTSPTLCGNISQLDFSAEDFIDVANITGYRWLWNGTEIGVGSLVILPSASFGSGGDIEVIPFNQCGEGNSISEYIGIITPVNLSVDIQVEDQGNDRSVCISEGDIRFQAIPSNSNTADFANNQYEFVHIRNNITIGTSIGDPFSDFVSASSFMHGDVIRVNLTAPVGGCYSGTNTVSDTLILKAYNKPFADMLSNRTELCEEDQTNIVLTARSNKGDNAYTWVRTDENGNEFIMGNEQTLTLNQPNQSGDYYLITDNAVCGQVITNSTRIKIYEQPRLLVEENLTIEIVEGAFGQLNVLSTGLINDEPTSITWSGNYLDNASILEPLIIPEGWFEGRFPYTLTVSTGSGNAICVDNATVNVLFKLPLNIPNAFTPNGDHENDTWIIDGILDFPRANVYIFNRWGYKIYQQLGGYVTPWDGTHYKSGALQGVGTYYYIIELNDFEKTVKTGDLTILR